MNKRITLTVKNIVVAILTAILVICILLINFEDDEDTTTIDDSCSKLTESFTYPSMEETASEEEEPEENESEIVEEDTYQSTSADYVRIESNKIEVLQEELDYCKTMLNYAQTVLDNSRNLGYNNDFRLIELITQDYSVYTDHIIYYETKIKELEYTGMYKEYPAATYIWTFLKEQGWNDYVCAGILGNIMQETGGRTLNIDYAFNGTHYYGMCCWRKEYHPDVVGKDLKEQCEYLLTTLTDCMNTYGYLYRSGYTFESFLSATSVEEAAAAFMIVYERPGHTNPTKRTQNGQKALDYFSRNIGVQ